MCKAPQQLETRYTLNKVHFVLLEQQRRNPFLNQPAKLTLLGKGPRFIPKGRALSTTEVLGASARINYRLAWAFERHDNRKEYTCIGHHDTTAPAPPSEIESDSLPKDQERKSGIRGNNKAWKCSGAKDSEQPRNTTTSLRGHTSMSERARKWQHCHEMLDLLGQTDLLHKDLTLETCWESDTRAAVAREPEDG